MLDTPAITPQSIAPSTSSHQNVPAVATPTKIAPMSMTKKKRRI